MQSKNMTPTRPGRAARYGKLKRGWNWRTTEERLKRMEAFAKKHKYNKTELIETAIDSLMDNIERYKPHNKN